MLLGKLSDKARSDIDRTNKGQAPLPADRPERKKPATPGRIIEDRLAPTSQEAYDPLKMDTLPAGFLSRVVNTQDSLPEKKRHSENYMHFSELLRGVCARAVRFTDENPGKTVYQAANGGQRLVWTIGRAVEKHIRDSYIKGVKGKGVYGEWSCKCEAVKKTGFYDANAAACSRCRTKPDTYGEASMFDHEAGIVGNPDMPIQVGDVIIVTEVKSMNGEEFDALKEAKPDHIYQAAGYVRLMRKNGFKVSDVVIIIYATKKYKFGSPYKEYHVNTKTKTIQGVLDSAWEAAKKIRASRLNKTIPQERVCSSANATQAKNCAHCTDCFMRR